MNTWFTSDLHLFHEPVLRYSSRPFKDIPEMHAALASNWNKHVREQDTVWILGDLSLGKFEETKEFLLKLNGKKNLVQGNHDKFSHTQYLKIGFQVVVQEAILKLFGHFVRLSHFPHRPGFWERHFMNKMKLRYMDRRPPKDGKFLLHGHTHSKDKLFAKNPKSVHIGVDSWNYRPVSLQEIESLIGSRV